MFKKFDSIEDLLEFSKKIKGKKVSDLLKYVQEEIKESNKGKIGQIVEKYFYGKELDSSRSPDFSNLGVELKVTPIKKIKNKNQEYSPKERLKLSIIDEEDLLKNKELKDSSVWRKIKKLLIIWYLHNDNYLDSEFKFVNLFDLEKDNYYYNQLNKDWQIIRDYFMKKNEDKLSETLTTFLAVVRCGSGTDEKKIESKSGILYYRRAFSLKPSFIKILLEETLNIKNKSSDLKSSDLDIYLNQFRNNLINKKLEDLAFEKNIKFNKKQKNVFNNIFSKYFDNNSYLGMSKYIEENFGEYVTFKQVTLYPNWRDRLEKNSSLNKEGFKLNVNLKKEVEKEWEYTELSKIIENRIIIILVEHNNDIMKSKILDFKSILLNDKEVTGLERIFEEFKSKWFNGGISTVDNSNFNLPKRSTEDAFYFNTTGRDKNSTVKTAANETIKKPSIWLSNTSLNEIIIKNFDLNNL